MAPPPPPPLSVALLGKCSQVRGVGLFRWRLRARRHRQEQGSQRTRSVGARRVQQSPLSIPHTFRQDPSVVVPCPRPCWRGVGKIERQQPHVKTQQPPIGGGFPLDHENGDLEEGQTWCKRLRTRPRPKRAEDAQPLPDYIDELCVFCPSTSSLGRVSEGRAWPATRFKNSYRKLRDGGTGERKIQGGVSRIREPSVLIVWVKEFVLFLGPLLRENQQVREFERQGRYVTNWVAWARPPRMNELWKAAREMNVRWNQTLRSGSTTRRYDRRRPPWSCAARPASVAAICTHTTVMKWSAQQDRRASDQSKRDECGLEVPRCTIRRRLCIVWTNLEG